MQPTERINSSSTVCFDAGWRSIEEIVALAEKSASASLSPAPEFRAAIARGADFLDRRLVEEGVIYGVTTGFGDSCTVAIQPELIAELPRHLYTFHGCGLGAHFSPSETRAVIATRLTSLCKGFSGVSVGLLEQLTGLLAQDILPAIPCEGSVGASGDLTPLSYLAAVLCGEGEVLRAGATVPAAAVLADAGITPLRLRPKEALAIMNGTAVMTGLACLNYVRAEYLTRLTTRITALASFALDGNAEHFDETLFSVKPHPGQQAVAGWLRQDLPVQQSAANGKRLQDRYSIRCAPHVIGVLADALSWLRSYIENELNSANDNPIIDADRRTGAAWRPFLRRPHRLRHGQHEKRRGQLGRFARPANGLVGRQPLQQWLAGQSLRRRQARARRSIMVSRRCRSASRHGPRKRSS